MLASGFDQVHSGAHNQTGQQKETDPSRLKAQVRIKDQVEEKFELRSYRFECRILNSEVEYPGML